MDEKSVWTEFLSTRQAQRAARALREAGYNTATASKCRGYVINMARYFEPADTAARLEVLRIICEAAGIQPERA